MQQVHHTNGSERAQFLERVATAHVRGGTVRLAPVPRSRRHTTMPLAPEVTATHAESSVAVLEHHALPLAATPNPHILLVEDDPQVARVITETLELEGDPGWSVNLATDGSRALDLAFASPPRVVLLDVMLPGLDGGEVYRRLRANPRTSATRVLFLSAATSLDLYQRGIDAGVLLRKPFEVRELVRLVRTLLAG